MVPYMWKITNVFITNALLLCFNIAMPRTTQSFSALRACVLAVGQLACLSAKGLYLVYLYTSYLDTWSPDHQCNQSCTKTNQSYTIIDKEDYNETSYLWNVCQKYVYIEIKIAYYIILFLISLLIVNP